jgi:hypothetical protein
MIKIAMFLVFAVIMGVVIMVIMMDEYKGIDDHDDE